MGVLGPEGEQNVGKDILLQPGGAPCSVVSMIKTYQSLVFTVIVL